MHCNCRSAHLQPVGRKAAPVATRALAGLSIAGGLLSSSCCVVQLLLNAFRLGCAGFAILTPWQTQFRALTAISLAHLVYRDGINRRSLLTVALTIALMFSQDAVRLHNLYASLPSPPPTGETRQRSFGASEPLASAPEQQAPRSDAHAASHAEAPHPPSSKPHHSSVTAGSSESPDPHTPDHDQDRDQGNTSQSGLPPGRPVTPTRAPEASGRPVVASGAYAAAGAADLTGGLGTQSASGGGGGVYLRFHVDGIKCEGCAARLKAELSRRLPGLQHCVVDFGSRQILLWGAPGAELTAAAARAAIQFVDLSYRPTLVESRGL